MQIKIVGNAIVATSKIKLADFTLLEKHNPSALKLKDKEGNTVFDVCKSSKGYVKDYGVCFNGATRDENQFLTLTLDITGIADAKEYAADTFGKINGQIAKIEKQVTAQAASTASERKAFVDAIEVE